MGYAVKLAAADETARAHAPKDFVDPVGARSEKSVQRPGLASRSTMRAKLKAPFGSCLRLQISTDSAQLTPTKTLECQATQCPKERTFDMARQSHERRQPTLTLLRRAQVQAGDPGSRSLDRLFQTSGQFGGWGQMRGVEQGFPATLRRWRSP
ncbi:hypothetical protein VTK56DRAFT_3503 [Thermocarpiscus australiensis]